MSRSTGHRADAHDAPPGGVVAPPEARIDFVFQVYAAHALMSLGLLEGPDGEGAGRAPDFAGAAFAIEMLEILEHKTRGNLSDEESAMLQQLLGQARLAFVEVKRRAST